MYNIVRVNVCTAVLNHGYKIRFVIPLHVSACLRENYHGCREEFVNSHLGNYSAWFVTHSPQLRHLRQIAEVATKAKKDSLSTFYKQCIAV